MRIPRSTSEIGLLLAEGVVHLLLELAGVVQLQRYVLPANQLATHEELRSCRPATELHQRRTNGGVIEDVDDLVGLAQSAYYRDGSTAGNRDEDSLTEISP